MDTNTVVIFNISIEQRLSAYSWIIFISYFTKDMEREGLEAFHDFFEIQARTKN